MLHKKYWQITALLAIVAIVLAACAGATPTAEPPVAEEPPAEEVEPIRIGISAVLSGPGTWVGETYVKGATMAVEEINAEGGILGRPVEIFTADNQCNNAEAASATRKLIDLDKVDVILGSGCSGVTLAAMPIIAEEQVPELTVNSTNPDIYDQSGVGGNIWQFRLCIDDRIIAERYGSMIVEVSNKVAALAYNDDWGRGAVGAYKPVFDDLGAELVAEEYFDEGAVDYGPIITNIKNSGAGVLLLIMEYKEGVPFLRQMNELGLEIPIYSRGGMVRSELVEGLGDDAHLAEGIFDATWVMEGVDPDFDRRFRERYGDIEFGHAQMPYYGIYVIKEAIEIMGKADRESIREGLERVELETGIGLIEFDDHHQAYPILTIGVLRDGEVVLLEVVQTAPEE